MLDWMRYLDLDPCLASNPPWTMACNAHVVGRSLLENKGSVWMAISKILDQEILHE